MGGEFSPLSPSSKFIIRKVVSNMKCSSDCKFLTSINSKGKSRPYCSRTGWDINDLPKEVIEDCPKYIDKNYIRHDILSSDY